MKGRRSYRRTRTPKIKKWGQWFGYGRHVVDANSGCEVPERLTVVDPHGNRVYRDYREGTRDRPDNW